MTELPDVPSAATLLMTRQLDDPELMRATAEGPRCSRWSRSW
jgi:hypothetical protein